MRTTTLKLYFDLCGLISALAWGGLVLASRVQHAPLDLSVFFFCMATVWLGYLGAFHCARQTGTITFQRIVLWMIVFRIIAWFGAPVYDDDHFRYLWDGRAFAEEGSPYSHTPQESFGNATLSDNFQRILDHVSNPQLHSDSQPVCQVLYLFCYCIAPGQSWPLKALLFLADLLAMVALMQLVSPRQSLLWGWCPLLLFETYFHLHMELFVVALVLLAVLHLSRRQHTPASVISSLAVGAHPFSLFTSIWVVSKTKTWEWAVSLITLVLVYGFFIYHDGWNVFSGIWHLITHSEFNSFVYGYAINHLSPLAAVGVCSVGLGVFLGFWLRHTRLHSIEAPRFDWFFIGLFLFLPTVYPSFLLWVLPWAVLRPRLWTFSTLAAVMLSYCYGQNLPPSDLAPFSHPDWVRPCEIGFVGAVALLEYLFHLEMKRPKH